MRVRQVDHVYYTHAGFIWDIFEKWDMLGGFEQPKIPPTDNMKIYENTVGLHSNCDSDML